jgi:hypothetical protein
MTRISSFLRILGLLLALSAGSAHATFHLWQITQLYSNADGTVQYVELQAYSSGQQYIAGHAISATQGSTTHTFTFNRNLDDDTANMSDGGSIYGPMMGTTYKTMLLGTQGFANLNVVPPDFIIPDGFLFTSNAHVDWGGGVTYDTLAYNALPTDGVKALFRSGVSEMNSPMNFDGLSGVISPAVLPNYTDLWWAGLAESGWGINFNHQTDTIFASLFTYAADGSGMWLVSTMAKQANGSFTGDLLSTTGPAFNASPWTAITATKVGTMTSTFAGTTAGTLVYSVNGTSVTKSIQRQVFSTEPTCTFTNLARTAATNYQDLWWNPNESGWGINFTHQGTTIFATLFTYSATKAMWLVATMTKGADGSFSGDLLSTTGPAFNTEPWTAIAATKVGTMQAAFTDGATGTLVYSVNGTSVTKAITRQVFGTTQTVCN